MHTAVDESFTTYVEPCPSSTQQFIQRSNHTPRWGCAEMVESLQLPANPFDDQRPPQQPVDTAHMEPLSSFARWQIEEDRKFYAMFPEARPANQWLFQCTPDKYFEVGGHQTSPEMENWDHPSHSKNQATIEVPSDESTHPNIRPSPRPSHTTNAHLSPPTLHNGYLNVLDHTKRPALSPEHSLPHTVLPQHDSARRSSYDPTTSQPEIIYLPQPASSPHDELMQNVHIVSSHQPHHIVPSQQQPIHEPVVIPSQETEQLMDHLPSPTTSHSSTSPPLPQEIYINHGCSSGSSYYQMEPSTFWPVYPQQQITGLDPHFRHPAQAFVSSIRPPGWPPSPRIRLSPLPSKRVLEKKPPLACLFCRGRKIACGPPEPGTTEKTCNQCQRRSIKCEYPSESRRGMRTKKTISNKVNTAGPKVKLGKGPKLKR